jgi:MFS family permease
VSETKDGGAAVTRVPVLIPALLVSASFVSILSTDLYTPSLPHLQGVFETDAERVQLAMSLNLLGFALAPRVSYQPARIDTPFTALSGPLAKQRRPSWGGTTRPSRRRAERAGERGLRWGGAACRRAQIGHAGAALARCCPSRGAPRAGRSAP